MDTESQLEELAARALSRSHQINLSPPIFELYASLLAMSLAILLFIAPELIRGQSGLDMMMRGIAPQIAWAFGFFTAGVVSAIGMLANIHWLRVIGLIMLSILYGAITIMYGLILPNFGFVILFWTTLFTIASIPLVRFTGIWHRKERNEEIV